MSYSPMNYGDIPPRIGVVAHATMLAYANSQLCLEKYGMMAPLPKNRGQTLKFRRPVPFAVSTSTLTEGVTPPPQILEYEDVSVSVSQYGAWIPFTDVIQDTHEDPNLQVMSELCGKQAADTKEAIIWGVLRGGTAVAYSGAATSRLTVNAPLSIDDIDAAVRELKANHALKITKIQSASDKVGTEAIQPAYVAVGHINLERDIRALPGFVSYERYGSGGQIHPNEIGSLGQVRVILTPHLEPFFGAGSSTVTGVLNNGTAVDVYSLVIFGEDAYGITPLKGMDSAAITVLNPKVTYEDPLAQRGMVSWKMWYAAVRLNESWMYRIECAATSF